MAMLQFGLNNFILPLILFFLSGFCSIIIKNKLILSLNFAASALFACLFFGGIFLSTFAFNASPETFSYIFGNFTQEIGIEYTLNAVNSPLLFFSSFLVFGFAIFFGRYVLNLEKDINFSIIFVIIQIFCGAIIAVFLTNDLFNFYIFFELAAICAYIFTALGGKGASYASLNYLILGGIASGFIVLGIGAIYFSSGFLNISLAAEVLKESHILPISFGFFLIGFAIKLALFPFSFWQSLVYKSMSQVLLPLYSALISLVTFYAFYKFNFTFFIGLDFQVVVGKILGYILAFGVLLFSIFAIYENDLRKIFAYSTISQSSYAVFAMFIGLNSGNGAESVAFLHLINNSVTKFALFILIFAICSKKGNFSIGALAGLASKSPLISALMVFFLSGIVGIPGTFGFFTKLNMTMAAIQAENYLFVALILLGAILNFLYFWKIASIMFFEKDAKQTPPLSLKMPAAFISLSFAILLIFLTFGVDTFTLFNPNALIKL